MYLSIPLDVDIWTGGHHFRSTSNGSALTNKISTQRDLFVARLCIEIFPCYAFGDCCFCGGRRTGFPLDCLFAFSADISLRSSMGLISCLSSPGLGCPSS